MDQKEITYSEFYELIFESLPDFRKLEVFDEYKDEINDGFPAIVILSELARKMMKETENGNEKVADKLLGIVENVLADFPDSRIAALIGTDFIVSILEYPMEKELKISVLKKMGKETLRGYEISKNGYREIFK
ncbi:hypothetical protein [Aquimarina sp. 433]